MLLPFFSLSIIATIVELATAQYHYGYRDCQDNYNSYNLTWYPLMDITVNTSNTNSEYQYILSPCNLSFYSSEFNQTFALKRYDLKTGQEKYLIPSFDDVRVEEEPAINAWKFEYSHPNISCPNQVQIIQLIWQCNSSIDNFPDYYQTISAGPLSDCYDSLFFQSPFACDNPLNPTYPSNCTFSSNGKTLNLYEYPITGAYEEYAWAACHNTIIDYGSDYGSLYLKGEPYLDTVYYTWDPSIGISNYDYDPTKNVWNFTLFGYDITRQLVGYGPYHCDIFATYVIYGCNCDTSNRLSIKIIEHDQECYMIINVTRNDLCINYINQCYPNKNNTDCVYYYRDDESTPYDKLNLTSLTNDDIFYVEDSGLYAFHYTPCNNNFYCTNITNSSISILSMAGRRAINSNKCVDPLAIFNGTNSFNVSHEMGTTTWTIEYFNGECPTKKNDSLRFRTTWKYSDTEWAVGSVDFQDDECLYDVTIYTLYTNQ